MTGIRVSVIDDLPQLAAAGASLQLQRLADNLGHSIGHGLVANACYPNLVGMAARAEMQRQLEALQAQVDLDRYLNVAACLGVDPDAAHVILRQMRLYFRPWADGPATPEEIEEAKGVLHVVAPLVPQQPSARERRERERLKRLLAHATETLARHDVGQSAWPCCCSTSSRAAGLSTNA
ncbi:hypothetical protein [Streptomyces sp. NPDC051554]|uniref:hypothetical protein n=1 Tax=Streptomyces sp. NPDC051554 TaxID=3365656 RepID=UPI0037A2183F